MGKMAALGLPTHMELKGYCSAGLEAIRQPCGNTTKEGLRPTNEKPHGTIHVMLGAAFLAPRGPTCNPKYERNAVPHHPDLLGNTLHFHMCLQCVYI